MKSWRATGSRAKFNPLREEDDRTSLARLRGTVVHCFVLYGRETFEARYAPLHLDGRNKAGVAERNAVTESGKIGLRWSDYARIMQAGTILRIDPYLRVAFDGGVRKSSIFFTQQGIRKKARFDYLKLRAMVDLKSMSPHRKLRAMVDLKSMSPHRSSAASPRNVPMRWRAGTTPPSRALLQRPRRAARPRQRGPRVGDHDAAWLREVTKNDEWAWVWVFWQTVGPPLTGSLSLTPGSPVLETAHRMLETAEANFCSFRDEFCMATPWIRPQPTRELNITDIPAWWGQ